MHLSKVLLDCLYIYIYYILQPSKKPYVKEVEHRDEQEKITFVPEESCGNDANKSEISSNNYVSPLIYYLDLNIINTLYILHFAAI